MFDKDIVIISDWLMLFMGTATVILFIVGVYVIGGLEWWGR